MEGKLQAQEARVEEAERQLKESLSAVEKKVEENFTLK
jgi:hypothetical protein